MLVIPLAWKLAPHLGMVDHPDPRKVHTVPVPRVGGWGIVLGTMIPLIILAKLDPLMQSYLIGGFTLFVFGMWDDAKQISHWPKFAGQIFAAGMVVYYGDLYITHFPFLDDGAISPLIAKPFTIFAMIGMINAINHSDGLDGLAGGESLLSLITIAFLASVASSGIALVIAFATMGGILGFLRYNTHPAQVFMGDTGSQFLGFTLAFLAIYLTQVGHPALSPALPLLFLGLPISDIIAVLYQRIRAKMNWFRATRNHVHHRLLDLGFDHYETVVAIYSVQAILVISAVLLRYQFDWVVAGTYLLVIGGLFAGLTMAERRGWRARDLNMQSGLEQFMISLKTSVLIQKGPVTLMSVLIPVFLITGSLWVASVPRDFGVVSGVLFIVAAVELLSNKKTGSLLLRCAVYVAAVFVAYLFIYFPQPGGFDIPLLTRVLIAVIAVCIGVATRFSMDKTFGTTPTDYLIVFGVLAVAAFGYTDITAKTTCELVLYAVVLLYGSEVIFGRMTSRWHILNLSTLAVLGILGLRGLLLS